MTLQEQLLEKLPDWQRDKSGVPFIFTDSTSGWTVEVNADHNDQIGCRVRELKVTHAQPRPLSEWATRSEERVKGLKEPLRLLELDGGAGSALLRSESPSTRQDNLQYFELLLQASGSGTLRRYQIAREPGSKREVIPFSLTHETLAEVVEDLTAPL